MNRIKKGDIVVVRTGKDKGVVGEVLQMMLKHDRAIVRGVNIRTNFNKPTKDAPGAIIKKEGSIHLSNLSLVNLNLYKEDMQKVPSLKDYCTKVSYKTNKYGDKQRVSKKTNTAF